MSRFFTNPPPKKLVCKLLGVSKTKTVQFRNDFDVKTLQHQIHKKFNCHANPCDLVLIPTKNWFFKNWLGVSDEELVEKIAKADSLGELEKILRCSQLVNGKSILPEVFRSAREQGVIHIVAKECPVHPTRAARWGDIQRILPPQEPFVAGINQKTPPLSKWYELYERTYEPQLQRHSEAVMSVDPKIIDELVETLEEPRGAFGLDLAHEFHLYNMLMPCNRRHPDLEVGSGGLVEGYRVKYHGLMDTSVLYKGSTILLGQTRCDDVKRDIARILTQCELMADSCELHEVYGVVVTIDGKWIFLRSLDDKILIDDDDDNRLVFGEDRKPSRESVAKIAGKLHGMVMTHVPAPPPGWSYWFEDEDEYEYDDDEEEG